ncbi:MAG: heavy metal translocating P-type ATPase metal-binding domain-containing protein [Bacteriovoracaceae bacterium]|nr:heavy metal translocating P-type ATPase metal-binding domain-containing protein [Bacteriovoracaceae bacterium]
MERDNHTYVTESSLACSHCGEKVISEFKNLDDNLHVFCCSGCRAVFNILSSKGLSEYYELKQKGPTFRARSPIKEVQESYRYMDSKEFEEEFANYDSTTKTKSVRFYLEGIHCLACLWLLEKLPEINRDVKSSRLDLSSSVFHVTVDEKSYLSNIAREIAELGYPPHPLSSNADLDALETKENRKDLSRIGVSAFCAMNIMLYSVSLYGGASGAFASKFGWTTFFLSLPVMLYSAIPFYKNAWSTLKKGIPSIDQPVALALIVGTIAGFIELLQGKNETYFDSLSVLVFLLLFSRYILKKAQKKGLDSSLAGSFFGNSQTRRWNPDKGTFEEIYSRFLKKSDLIKVMPGEIFPADGVMTKGETYADLSLLSGESTPQQLNVNQNVFSGTTNLTNPVEMKVDFTSHETRLGKILEKIQTDRSEKSPLLTTVDKFSHKFIISLFILSAIVLAINWILLGASTAISRTLSLIIVTCPCALALATPLALSRSLNLAAKAGIIIKSFDVIERIVRAKKIFFDKTGTLTYGTLSIDTWEDLTKIDVPTKEIIFSLEKQSKHPVGVSIYSQLKEEGTNELPVTDFFEHAGLGVSGTINGQTYQIKKLDQNFKQENLNTVGLFRNDDLLTIIGLKDSLRPEARDLIGKIRKMNKSPYIVSGDNDENVSRIGSELGVNRENLYSNYSPEEKHQLVSSSEDLIMIGDGANDAMALQKSDVGIAVSGSVEVSLRAADVYITTPGIKSISNLMELSSETIKLIKRNLIISIFYNLIGATAASMGFITPLTAAILMPISSLTVLYSTIYGTGWLRRWIKTTEVTL